jgi:hypothetical protein
MRLLRVLKDGRLKAQNDDQVLPDGYWANSIATVGDLSAATPSLRLARADILRIFPKTTTPSYREVRARRHQPTRQGLGC